MIVVCVRSKTKSHIHPDVQRNKIERTYPLLLTIHEPNVDRWCRRRLDLRGRFRWTTTDSRSLSTPLHHPLPHRPALDNPFRPLENTRSTRDDPNRCARDSRAARPRLGEALCNRKWNPCAYIRWMACHEATFLTGRSSSRENNLGITDNWKAPRWNVANTVPLSNFIRNNIENSCLENQIFLYWKGRNTIAWSNTLYKAIVAILYVYPRRNNVLKLLLLIKHKIIFELHVTIHKS